MKKLRWSLGFLLAILVCCGAAAALENDTVKVGLRYGSSAMFSANLENAVGSGYAFGYYDAGRSFVEVGETGRTAVSVTAAGKDVTVTAREFEILALLMSYPKKVFTREQLYEQVWGGAFYGDDNTVNVHISNLRSKLSKACPGEYIKTVWGIGFKLADL